MIRDARIAEAQAKTESIIQDSGNNRDTALRELLRDEEIAKIEADKAVRDTLTKRTALIKEVEGDRHRSDCRSGSRNQSREGTHDRN